MNKDIRSKNYKPESESGISDEEIDAALDGNYIVSEEVPDCVIFRLDERQMEILGGWRDQITALHGKVGTEEFCFTSTGIGTIVAVKNRTFNIELDLTDVGGW